jgi:hypothetical protein
MVADPIFLVLRLSWRMTIVAGMDWQDKLLNFLITTVMVITWPIRFIWRLLVRALKDILNNVYARAVAIIGGVLIVSFISWLLTKSGNQ